MNPQAEELNNIIQSSHPAILDMFSEKGENIFFPKKGILAQTADAKGKAINATIGAAIEDDGSPMRLPVLEDLVNLDSSMVFPYAPSFGRPDMRKHWKQAIYQKNPALDSDPVSLPVVTNALTHGLSIMGYLFLDENDKILVSDLFWGNYKLIFDNAYKAQIETFKLFKDNAFNIASFREKIMIKEAHKKVLLLNFPNNPTGYTPTGEEMQCIIAAIKESAEAGNKLVVISDDAYFGLVYEDGIEKQSPFAYLANLHENILAVKIDGPTKEDYVWGFRTGFITYGIRGGHAALYNALESKTAGVVRGNISNACNTTQSLLLEAYKSSDYHSQKQVKYELLKERYDAVKKALEIEKYKDFFSSYPFNSGYFMCVQLKRGIDGEKVRQLLLDKYNSGVINMNNIIRIAFSAVAKDNIPQLFENIYNACKEVAG